MGDNKTQIDFVKVKENISPSGAVWSGPCCVFQVHGREVEVSVGYAASDYGKMPPERVQLAAKTFLEMQVGLGVSLPQRLTLNAPKMNEILRRLSLETNEQK